MAVFFILSYNILALNIKVFYKLFDVVFRPIVKPNDRQCAYLYYFIYACFMYI